jgi:hypothetical protein
VEIVVRREHLAYNSAVGPARLRPSPKTGRARLVGVWLKSGWAQGARCARQEKTHGARHRAALVELALE